jgi:uncharacterized membrane protein YjjP (DUF1212 family)
MQNGGSTVLADRTFRTMLRGFNAEDVWASWRLDLVTVRETGEGPRATVFRQVGPIGVNLVRASEAAVLAERFARGEVRADALGAEIKRLEALPVPYRTVWAPMAAAAFVSAATSQLLGGGWGAPGISLVAGAAGQFVRFRLQPRKIAAAPLTLIAAFVSACLAGVGLRLGLSHDVAATLTSSVFYMVPGLPLINGFVDMVSHRHLFVGLERIANAAFLFLTLAIAWALAYSFIM